ncbi:MAG: hypothetical protein MZU79_02320 [Anaerotruncus sp.]|nr:hypothetical protein [Anaerotruncus sp.]
MIDLRPRTQIALVAGVSLAVAGLATWLELAWNTQLLVVHLAYVPALLAAFFWGCAGPWWARAWRSSCWGWRSCARPRRGCCRPRCAPSRWCW